MRKRWLGVLLVIVVCLCSSSCGTKGSQGTTQPKQSAAIQSENNAEATVESENLPENQVNEDALAENFIGTYQGVLPGNETQNTSAIISSVGGGRFHIGITIIRLAALEDLTGYIVDDHIEFYGSDPSGNNLQGTMVCNNNKLIIEFTETTWDYFYNGMTLEMDKTF